MEKRRKQAVVHAPIKTAQKEEIGKILDRLVGTPVERTGDIAVEIGHDRFVAQGDCRAPSCRALKLEIGDKRADKNLHEPRLSGRYRLSMSDAAAGVTGQRCC